MNRASKSSKTFWKSSERAIELYEGSGAHCRQHCYGNVDTTVDVSYAPIVVSTPQLIKKTKQTPIEADKNQKEVDVYVPSKSWVYLQLHPKIKN